MCFSVGKKLYFVISIQELLDSHYAYKTEQKVSVLASMVLVLELTGFVLQAESTFSEEEEEKLRIAFSLEKQDLHLVLETISFVLEQVPFYHYELINIYFYPIVDLKNIECKLKRN